jgi:hypothetical protein
MLCNKNKIQVLGSNSFDTKFSDYLHILVRFVFISISQSFHLAGERLALLVCYNLQVSLYETKYFVSNA